MKAIIMAGGEGSRLRPLTCDLPKPMVPVMNKPIMEHIIELLKQHGITEIGVTLMYLPQRIKEYFGDGSNFGVKLHYFTEDTPLGTAGSVKNAEEFLDETFIVISGDSLTNINITEAINYHYLKKSKATLVLTKVDVPLEYGVVILDNSGSITGFLEKPSWGEVFSDTVNTGTYILEPEVLNLFAKNIKYDFSQDLFPILLNNKEPMFGFVSGDYWCDIGDLKAYLESHYDVLNGLVKLNFEGNQIEPGIWVGSGTIIDPKAKLNTPCVIGQNCNIGCGAIIDSYTVIGNNTTVEESVSIKRSIIWDTNYFEYNAEIRGAIITNRVTIKNGVSIFENAVIGEESIISEKAIIKPNVKIWPKKSVEQLTTVDRNIIWGSKHSKSIFGENGLSGIINVDISTEFATRLGAAYGSIFKKGSKVVVSSTTSNSVRMFKHAFVSGILSVGVEVFNLSSLLTPISRHAINFLNVEGGIHVKLSDNNPNKLNVDFMDSKGASISRVVERKIENAFFREDFKRCKGEEISKLNNITDFKNYYVRSILNDVDIEKIRNKNIKLCIVSPSDFVISVLVPMVTDLGCKVSFLSSNLNSDESISNIVKEINKNDADFAAYIDSNGENLVLIDPKGSVVKEDLFLSLISLLIFKNSEDAKVVVPITAPSVIESLADKYKGKVVRTKTTTQAVMEQMLNHNLFKHKENMHQFLLNFDAIAGLVKIIEFFCIENTTLSKLLHEIPEFFVSKRKIYCPWELKGRVMRTLITEKTSNKVELLDGVKFFLNNGWALVLPDADTPACRVYSEGETPQIADNISDKYIEKIKAIINS